MDKFIRFNLVLWISLVLLAISIEVNSYNKDFFQASYEKNRVAEITNLSMDQLMDITDNIILYLKNKGGNELLEPYFNQREILHMEDVQNLYIINRWIRNIGIFLLALISFHYIKNKQIYQMGKILAKDTLATYIFLGFLAISYILNFQKSFLYFHKIFFRNDLWILDPRTDLMIKMLPENFFMGMARNIFFLYIFTLILVQILGFIIIKRYRGKILKKQNKSKKIY